MFVSQIYEKSFLDFDAEEKRREGCISCARYALVVCNILFFVGGVVLVCLAAWIRWTPANINVYAISTSTSTRDYAIFMTTMAIATGTSAALLAIIGSAGTSANSKYILGMFFMFMVVLLPLLLTLGGFAIWLLQKAQNDVLHQLQVTFIEDYGGDTALNIESLAWKYVQTDLRCCGVSVDEGYKDYHRLSAGIKHEGVDLVGAAFWRNANSSFERQWPNSCCLKSAEAKSIIDHQQCFYNESATSSRHSQGCGEAVRKLLQVNFIVVIGLTAFLILMEMINFGTLRQLEAAILGDDDDSIITDISAISQQEENYAQLQ